MTLPINYRRLRWLSLSDIEGAWDEDKEAAANAAFIVRAVNSHNALVKALSIFLGEDGRFQVAIGGNPIAVDAMLAEARAVLASTREVQP
jgi:hypothetical protein